ncbi:hypothetical protein KKD88_03820 [Patescibacteria group bacterium]|nr:hypothetical protein [Patescibacteria group bacterium]
MNSINELQNRDSALQKLATQRCLYSEAKKIFYVRTFFAIAVAIALPYASEAYPSLKNWLTAIAIAYLLLDIFLLENVESEKRLTGAKVQEVFDTETLDIKWNGIVAEEKPDQEIVGRCLLKVSKKGFEAFRDWYPTDISQLPANVAKTLCQRANVWWDSNLRLWYARLLLLILILLSCFVLWTNKDKTVASAIIFFASFAPLFKLLVEQYNSHRKAAKRVDALKRQLNQILEDVLANNRSAVEESTTRSIQDEIFRHRSNVTPIPDLFYALLKKKYEHLMGFNAQEYVNAYLSRSGGTGGSSPSST